MCNLNEVTFYDDLHDQWAADREYEMRLCRYTLYLNGGMVGAAKKAGEAIRSMSRALAGVTVDRQIEQG